MLLLLSIAVGIIFGAAGLGSAIGWGLITSKTIEGITRQPEMRPQLLVNTFIFAGLMEFSPSLFWPSASGSSSPTRSWADAGPAQPVHLQVR